MGLVQGVPTTARAFYLLGILAGTWLVLPKAWHALRRFRPDMNLLMVVAIVGAVVIGEWLEAVTVAFLFALSLALEAWSIGRARRAVAALLELAPATALIGGRPFWIGSHRYLEERKQETPEIHQRLEAMSAAGRTVVVVGNDQHVCGLIALADAVRPQVRAALDALRVAGIEHLIMLTGDNRGTAEAIARETGVDEIKSELLPGDKVGAVEALVERYGTVAMIGDGVNDAPALARATLGIAMGAAGSDAAIETADIALMSDDLMKLPWLIHHSRRTLAIIRQNIIFSLTVKTLFVVLTFAGFASLWGAIAADAGASLLVVFNGLRLLRTR